MTYRNIYENTEQRFFLLPKVIVREESRKAYGHTSIKSYHFIKVIYNLEDKILSNHIQEFSIRS